MAYDDKLKVVSPYFKNKPTGSRIYGTDEIVQAKKAPTAQENYAAQVKKFQDTPIDYSRGRFGANMQQKKQQTALQGWGQLAGFGQSNTNNKRTTGQSNTNSVRSNNTSRYGMKLNNVMQGKRLKQNQDQFDDSYNQRTMEFGRNQSMKQNQFDCTMKQREATTQVAQGRQKTNDWYRQESLQTKQDANKLTARNNRIGIASDDDQWRSLMSKETADKIGVENEALAKQYYVEQGEVPEFEVTNDHWYGDDYGMEEGQDDYAQEQKTVTRTGTRADGRKVIEYSDGSREVQ